VTVVVGVDVAEARKGLDVVVLDDGRRVITARRRATAADVSAIATELRPALVCIDSPPGWATAGRSRAAERELRALGISAYATPTDPGDHPFYRWMRAGFAVFEAVAASHPRHRSGELRGTAVEVFPEATAVLLAGRLRPNGETKRDFRRAVLADHGVDTTSLTTPDLLDAALAALTGVLALEGAAITVGDPDEGVVLLPVGTLPGRLRREVPGHAA
jgi:predicted nuclease with RNAse H fold